MSRTLPVLICLTFAALCGCSNLVARKVPLPCRFTKQDYKVEGFRYYLSRPHLVVSREVSVLKTLEYGVLVSATVAPTKETAWEGAPYAIQVWDGTARNLEYRDMAGRVLNARSFTFRAVTTPQADAADSPDAAPSADTGRLFGFATAKTPEDPPKDEEPPVDAFQIAYLPDFEEQMAVKQHNFLAKSKFQLQFLDGWQLKSVETTGDSTDVPIRILQTLGRAITAAGEVEEARINARGSNQPSPSSSRVDKAELRAQRVMITHNFYIEPGMYRLTKESERSAGPHESSWGILADMGVPVLEDTKVQLLAEKAAVVEKKCSQGEPMPMPMPMPAVDDDGIPGPRPMTPPALPAPPATPAQPTGMRLRRP